MLGVYPEGTISVQHINFPVFDKTGSGDNIDITSASDNAISNNFNFPDEAEHIVVLYAAIRAAQSLLASEEDDELYDPIIDTLKEDYLSSLQAIGAEKYKDKSPKKKSNALSDLLAQQ